MTVHRKCAIVLMILCARSCLTRSPGSGTGDNNVSEDTEEDGKISQALVLVDLLKHEYVKALRENYELRKGSTFIDIEESTCAPSDAPSTSGGPSDQHSNPPLQPPPSPIGGPRMAGVTPQPFQLFTGRNYSFEPYQFFRRRIPIDYYYDGSDAARHVFYRRHEVKPAEAELAATKPAAKSPVEPNTTVTVPGAATDVVVPAAAAKSKGFTLGNSFEKRLAYRRQNQKSQESAITSKEAETPEAPTKTEAPAVTEAPDSDNTAEDPVQAQVLSEINSELKIQLNDASTNAPATKTPKTADSKKLYLQLIKPTLKIHLGGSTRYPLPLPENHAFCYTNPRNALCRTSI